MSRTEYRGLVKWYDRGLQNLWWEFDSLIPCSKKSGKAHRKGVFTDFVFYIKQKVIKKVIKHCNCKIHFVQKRIVTHYICKDNLLSNYPLSCLFSQYLAFRRTHRTTVYLIGQGVADVSVCLVAQKTLNNHSFIQNNYRLFIQLF